jgi:hypothetical protein
MDTFGNIELPAVDIFYKNIYLQIHKDVLELLIKSELTEGSPIDLSNYSRFKSEILNIINNMENESIEIIEDEYSYIQYIFHLKIQAQLALDKDSFTEISFQAQYPILHSSIENAYEELENIKPLNKIIKNLINIENISIDEKYHDLIKNRSLKNFLFKDVSIKEIIKVEINDEI